MKVLIGCEESQAVCIAFRERGFEAYSCDLQECSGGHPEWHLKMDVFDAIELIKPDLLIAHPACTFMTNSGVCHLVKGGKAINGDRWIDLYHAIKFFNKLKSLDIKMIAVENPIPHKYARDGFFIKNEPFEDIDVTGIGRYTQLIQPYMFGHMERKATCLWLKGLPELQQTNNVFNEMKLLPKNKQQRLHYLSPGKNRAKERSKTFPGIARAMAKQWGDYIRDKSFDNSRNKM